MTESTTPIWERTDSPKVNIRANVPQPTGVRWDSPLEAQENPWLIGESGEDEATYPVEKVFNANEMFEGKPIRVQNPTAPPFGLWRQVIADI